MKKIDFLNSSPKFFIFNNESNKTNFGGVLFLIYLIIMFFISLAYIYDYASNEKYEVQGYINDANNKYYGDDLKGNFHIDFNRFLNVTEKFIIELIFYQQNESKINEIINSTILEYKGKQYKGRLCHQDPDDLENKCNTHDYGAYKMIFNLTANIIDEHGENTINIYYQCNDYNCSNFPNDSFYYLIINTKDFDIKHNEPNPIVTHDCLSFQGEFGEDCQSNYGNSLFDDKRLWLGIKLSTILYQDKKGISRIFDKILGKKNNYSISYILKDESESYYYEDNYVIEIESGSDETEEESDYGYDYEESDEYYEYEDEYEDEYEYEYENEYEDEYEDEEEKKNIILLGLFIF